MRLAMILLVASPAVAAERTLQYVLPPYVLPAPRSIVVTAANAPAPALPKHSAIASVVHAGDSAKLPNEGPFDLWFVPKDGKPVRMVQAFKANDGKNVLAPHDYLGVIQFRGDGQPRGSLIVTSTEDQGPEEKGHVVIQTASDTRADLVVPPGDYSVWVLPESGARARRVVDKIRVYAGKTATVD